MFTHFQHVLGKKILLYILLCSSVLTMATAIIQLYSDYQNDMHIVEERINEVDSTQLKTLAVNLWDFQDNAINQQLEGLVHIAAFQYVVLSTPHGDNYTAGTQAGEAIENHSFDVTYNKEVIGQLTLSVNYDEIYQKLRNKAWLVLITQFIQTFLVALCIMMIVYWLVTRHIYRIVELTKRNFKEHLNTPLTLEGDRSKKDELDLLAQTLNDMRLNLKQDFEKRQQAEEALQLLNTGLENIVAERTEELENTIRSLEETRNELVQSEKMASLGQLVAGVSHEINTPLGIVVTATSGMRENITSLEAKVTSTSLKKSHLLEYIQHQKDALTITEKSLERAVNLINNFKTVSVNQSSDTLIATQMQSLVDEITNTVQTLFKQENYQINTTIDHDLILTTYPGAWAQIITNLLMNSHLHGFENRHRGNVLISLTCQGDDWFFTYQDNGEGIPEDILDSVFDPFVTTKRSKGGSGLGLNIVFNLVYSLLQGTISVENLEQGCRFTLKGPIMLSEETI